PAKLAAKSNAKERLTARPRNLTESIIPPMHAGRQEGPRGHPTTPPSAQALGSAVLHRLRLLGAAASRRPRPALAILCAARPTCPEGKRAIRGRQRRGAGQGRATAYPGSCDGLWGEVARVFERVCGWVAAGQMRVAPVHRRGCRNNYRGSGF